MNLVLFTRTRYNKIITKRTKLDPWSPFPWYYDWLREICVLYLECLKYGIVSIAPFRYWLPLFSVAFQLWKLSLWIFLEDWDVGIFYILTKFEHDWFTKNDDLFSDWNHWKHKNKHRQTHTHTDTQSENDILPIRHIVWSKNKYASVFVCPSFFRFLFFLLYVYVTVCASIDNDAVYRHSI